MRKFYFVNMTAVILGLALVCAGPAGAQNFADWSPEGSATSERDEPVPFDRKLISEDDLDNASAEEVLKMIDAPIGAKMLEETGGTYTLGPTDVIEINVMRHPEVSGQFPINNEGKIQYNFVGDILISGLTKEGAADVISKALAEYIVAPEVNIKIIGYNSKVVYVVGEVFRPGKVYMRGDTITVREALMKAGLPRLSGVTKKSRLIKPVENGKPDKKYLNVYALLYDGDLRYNDIMEPGDVLYIPPTFLTRVMRSIAPVAAPIGQAAGAHTGIGTLGTPVGETRY